MSAYTRDLRDGTKVQRGDREETGTVLGRTSWGAYRIAVDVDLEDWKQSVIGPPSRITAVWPSWETSRILDNDENEESK